MDLTLAAHPARPAAQGNLRRAAPLALVIGVLLALLAWAEVGWLPHGLPREYTVRVAVVLLPTGEHPVPEDGYTRLGLPAPGHAGTYALPHEVGSGADHRAASGQITLESRCVELETAAGAVQRGALVTAALRGPDRGVLEAAAATWLEDLRRQARAGMLGLRIERMEDLAVPYRLCAGA
jgi:hypothetical protein